MSSIEITAAWDDGEASRWYSIQRGAAAATIALCTRDDDGTVTCMAPGEAEAIDLAQVTSATRMAIVDHDWPARVEQLYLQLTDGHARIDAISDAVKTAPEYATSAQLLDELTDPDGTDPVDPETADLTPVLLRYIDQVAAGHAQFRAAVEAQLVPTKNGIVAL